MAQQNNLDLSIGANVLGLEQISRLINDVDKLGKTTKGLETAFARMGNSAKSVNDVQKAAIAIDAARADRIARLSQEFYNNALSIDKTAKSARDSASVFEEAFRAQDQFAAAQRQAAAAAADLRARLDPMIPIQDRFNAEMDQADDLLRQGAISQREYAQATAMARQNLYQAQQALHGLNTAQTGVIINGVRYNSMADAQSKMLRQQRQGVQQLGMQMNDFATSVSTGASPIQAFNQQIGQVGIALEQMGGTAGKVGAFMTGPWGTAITIATMALGFLAQKFLFAEDSAKKAASQINDLAQQFDFAKMSAEDLARVNDLLSQANRKIAETAIQAANATAAKASADANAAQQALNLAKAELAKRQAILATMKQPTSFAGGGVPGAALTAGQIAVNRQNEAIAEQETKVQNLSKAIDGFQFRSRKATAEVYTLSSALDKGGKATELHQSRINMLTNAYARGEMSLQRFNEEVDRANAAYAAAKDTDSGGKGRGRSTSNRDAQRAAREAEAIAKNIADVNIRADQDWRQYWIDAENNQYAKLQEKLEFMGVMADATVAVQRERLIKPFETQMEQIQQSFTSIGEAVANSFQGMLAGGMSWKDGMKGIINAVINELWRLFVVQQIVGLVTGGLNNLFGFGGGGGMGGVAKVKTGGNLKAFANGTVNAPGGMAWVGERGPELVNLPRGSQVIPAHRAQSMGGGGVTINVDARGSADPAAVRAQVQQGIIEAAPSIIAAAEARTVQGLRRPRLGGAIK